MLDILTFIVGLFLIVLTATRFQSQPLSHEQWAIVEESLKDGDDLSTAVGALFLQHIESDMAQNLLAQITEREAKFGPLTQSVLKTGQLETELEKASPKERVEKWTKMASDPNRYSRLTDTLLTLGMPKREVQKTNKPCKNAWRSNYQPQLN